MSEQASFHSLFVYWTLFLAYLPALSVSVKGVTRRCGSLQLLRGFSLGSPAHIFRGDAVEQVGTASEVGGVYVGK